MNILFVHDFEFQKSEDKKLFTAVGLPEIYFDRFLDSDFKHVKILSRLNKTQESSIIRHGFIEIKNTFISHVFDKKISYKSFLSIVFIKKVLQEIEKSDLVVLSIPSIFGAYIFILMSIFYRGKKFAVEVAADSNQFSSKTGGKIITRLFDKLMPLAAKRASGAAYVSDFLRKKYPNMKTELVSSNVNIKSFRQRTPIVNPIIEKANINIGFAGGIVKRKGIETILKAIKELNRNDIKNLKMHFMGGHDDRDWLSIANEIGIASEIALLGMLETSEMTKILDDCDIYLQPSHSEGLPRATIEAMSRGLPVIATKLPGFSELLHEEMLINIDDHLSLAKKIKEIVSDIKKYNFHSMENFKKSQYYAYSELHKKRVSHYKKILIG